MLGNTTNIGYLLNYSVRRCSRYITVKPVKTQSVHQSKNCQEEYFQKLSNFHQFHHLKIADILSTADTELPCE